MDMNRAFTKISQKTSYWAGRPVTFICALSLILIWATTGPLFGFGDTWQLVINTSTTIITFLMVFLIQSSQNRDTAALQMKMDELIRATRGAHNILLDLEELDEDEIQKVREIYEKIASNARDTVKGGSNDLDIPEIDLTLLKKGGKDVEIVVKKKP